MFCVSKISINFYFRKIFQLDTYRVYARNNAYDSLSILISTWIAKRMKRLHQNFGVFFYSYVNWLNYETESNNA
ncbi:hypothetical protein C2G38_796213 [Gigaspora rosea]|uniref:Uncharacterized protein n=1 Tax=Gigaspora rosea TaxID=44941 RepID=A0A397TZ82_9GLOM|nr:hypothetical protein C2G38_796213 [Gigaspora rosea]